MYGWFGTFNDEITFISILIMGYVLGKFLELMFRSSNLKRTGEEK